MRKEEEGRKISGWLGVEVVIARNHYGTKIKFRCSKTRDENQIFNFEWWVLKAEGGVQMGLVIWNHVGLRGGQEIIPNNALSFIDSLIDFHIEPFLKEICSFRLSRIKCIVTSDFDIMYLWALLNWCISQQGYISQHKNPPNRL